MAAERNETILIIDGQRHNVEFLTTNVLRPAGYNVSVARDGREGLDKALEEKPDLIILDLAVRRFGGRRVLQELRKVQKDVPVILTAFHGSEEATTWAFRLRARDYIIKPYRAERMRQAIERGLAERRLRYERDQLARRVTLISRQMERRLKELNVLSGIGKTVTALLDEDRVLTRVVEAAVYITGAEEGFLLLVDEESGELYVRALCGLGEKHAREFRLKVDDSLAGQVVQTGRPVIITGSLQEERFKVKTGYLVRSLLHVPLKVGESVIGVLSVDHMVEDRTFDNHDQYLLSALADYAAIALENSRLHAQLQQQAEAQDARSLVSPPGQVSGKVQPEMIDELNDFLTGLKSHREETQARIRAGKRMVSDLRERVASFDVWLDGIVSQEQSLAQSIPSPQGSVAFSSPVALRQDLNAILDSMMDGVLAIDRKDRVMLANRVAEAILGRELIGKTIDDVCDDPRWSKTYRIVKTAAQLQVDTPGSEIISAITPLLVNRRMVRASFRIKSSTGRVLPGMVVLLRDISADPEAQRVKDSFIASVSQELRTPMTSIVGYVDLLLQESVGRLTETQGKFLNRIRANAERIGSLLDDLVGMAIIDSRQPEIKAEAVDLMTTIREVAGEVRLQLAGKGQVIEMDLEPDLPLVHAGPGAMYHVLTNLLLNAHRCSREGARIVLHARRVREGQALCVAVSITDAGGGVAPEDYERVFNSYYRSDNPMVPGLDDPGVSLPIIKVLVEAYGGRMWLDTLPGTGTTFTFVLTVHRRAQILKSSGPHHCGELPG